MKVLRLSTLAVGLVCILIAGRAEAIITSIDANGSPSGLEAIGFNDAGALAPIVQITAIGGGSGVFLVTIQRFDNVLMTGSNVGSSKAYDTTADRMVYDPLLQGATLTYDTSTWQIGEYSVLVYSAGDYAGSINNLIYGPLVYGGKPCTFEVSGVVDALLAHVGASSTHVHDKGSGGRMTGPPIEIR